MKKSIFSLFFSNDKLNIFDKPFRKIQIFDFIFKKRVFNFHEITNIPQSLQKEVNDNFYILDVEPIDEKTSKDGTIKYLFKLKDENCIESVLLKDENERYTFCISTQVGCRFNCSFCMTGRMGFVRDLTYTEIISQILFLSKIIYKASIRNPGFNLNDKCFWT